MQQKYVQTFKISSFKRFFASNIQMVFFFRIAVLNFVCILELPGHFLEINNARFFPQDSY